MGIAVLGLAMGLLISATGCKTTAGGGFIQTGTNGIVTIGGWTVNTNDVYNAAFVAAKIGTQQGIRADAKSAIYFQMAEQVLTLAIANGELDPALIRADIASIDPGYAISAEASAGIDAGLALYQAFFGQVVSQNLGDASPYLIPILTALRDGIAAGLPDPASMSSLSSMP